MSKAREIIATLAGRDLPEGALMTIRSHINGRNALVTVWPDRIEWARTGSLGGRRDTNTIFLKSVTGIRTQRSSGLTYTDVSVESAGSSVVMRVTKAQAAALRQIVAEFSQK